MKKNVLKAVWERLVYSSAWFSLGMLLEALIKNGEGVIGWIVFVSLLVLETVMTFFIVLLSED